MPGYHSRLPRLGDVALWPDHRRAGAGFLVTRGGGGQTVAEHFPEREYRTGERPKAGVRSHGELIAGKLSKLRKRSGFRLCRLSGTQPGRPTAFQSTHFLYLTWKAPCVCCQPACRAFFVAADGTDLKKIAKKTKSLI
jgi:hypothetical protein